MREPHNQPSSSSSSRGAQTGGSSSSSLGAGEEMMQGVAVRDFGAAAAPAGEEMQGVVVAGEEMQWW